MNSLLRSLYSRGASQDVELRLVHNWQARNLASVRGQVVGDRCDFRAALARGAALLRKPTAIFANRAWRQRLHCRWQHAYNSLRQAAIRSVEMGAPVLGASSRKAKHFSRF